MFQTKKITKKNKTWIPAGACARGGGYGDDKIADYATPQKTKIESQYVY